MAPRHLSAVIRDSVPLAAQINDELGKSTADKGPEITESDERNGSTAQSPTPRSEQPINVH